MLESYDLPYCVRSKTKFFKNYISQMKSYDEWIVIKLDRAWLKRLKYDYSKERFSDTHSFRIRVVKSTYTYKDKYGNLQHCELLFFTNLSRYLFNSDEIVELYAKRWDIECTYKN